MEDRDHSPRKRVATPGPVRAFHEGARTVCSCGETGKRARFKIAYPKGFARSNRARSTTATRPLIRLVRNAHPELQSGHLLPHTPLPQPQHSGARDDTAPRKQRRSGGPAPTDPPSRLASPRALPVEASPAPSWGSTTPPTPIRHAPLRGGNRGRGRGRTVAATPTRRQSKHGQGSSGNSKDRASIPHTIRTHHNAHPRQRQQTIPRPIPRTQTQRPTPQPPMLDMRPHNRLHTDMETPNVIHVRPPAIPSLRRGDPWRGPTSSPQL